MKSQITLRILPTFSLVFLGYLASALVIGVLPTYLHRDLGHSTFVAGLFLSLQNLATLTARPTAGRCIDRSGSRVAMRRGLALCCLSGLVFIAATALPVHPRGVLALIAVSRVVLGFGESHVSAAGSTWGIARVGQAHTARVISWSGVGSYGSLALGAPAGMAIARAFGITTIGIAMAVVAAVAFAIATLLPDVPRPTSAQLLSGHKTLKAIFPYASAMALASVGFGSLAAFGPLFFEAKDWPGGPYLLTLYGVAFIASRIFLHPIVAKWDELVLTAACLAVEAAGLLLLAEASSVPAAMVASLLIGLGFSLVFPALGARAAASVSPSDRGSAISLYTGFIDLSLGFTGPLAGLFTLRKSYGEMYLGATMCALLALVICVVLWLRSRVPSTAEQQ